MNQHIAPQPTGDVHMERTDACNWSTLKAIGTSPKHYLHGIAHPRTDSPALLLGRLTHAMVFEPGEVAARYVQSPKFHRGMLDATALAKGYDGGKAAAAEWDAANVGREVVEIEQWDAARWMRDAILADPEAAAIVTSGWSERHIEWTDPQTGIECRGRVDHVNGRLVDLKTTRSLVTFERDVARFGYFAQLPWYYDGCNLAGVQFEGTPGFIAVENVAPFDVLVLWFHLDDLAPGRRVYRSNLARLAECRRSGIWPGYGGGKSRRIKLPEWAGPIETELTMDGVPI